MKDFWKVKVAIRIDKENWGHKISASGYATFMMSKIDGAIYKPVDIVLDKGSLISPVNSGGKNKDRVLEKEKFINDYCISSNGLKLIKDTSLSRAFQKDGYVSFFSALSGANQNRTFPCIIQSRHELLNGITLAEFIQQPKKYNGNLSLSSYEDIEIDDLFNIEFNQLTRLAENQFENIATCSISRVENLEFTNDKNGQMKSDTEVLESILGSEGQNRENKITAFFRKKIRDRFNKKCAICGVSIDQIMVASHIKAKHESDSIKEKIDENNGLWLCAGHDKLFDRRLITFDEKGKIMISNEIKDYKKELYLNEDMQLDRKIFKESAAFLAHHRSVFKDRNK